jgi:hypothetical protein
MRNFTSYLAKNFGLAKKLNLILMLLLIFGASTSSNAHAVQTAWCFAPNGTDVRVYVEHWHGPGQGVDCGGGATINLTVAINGGSPTVFNNVSFNANIPGTLATLPRDPNRPMTIISECASANTYNDWGSWDFPIPPGLCPAGGDINITVLSGNDCVYFQGCGGLYPASTNDIVTAAECPDCATTGVSCEVCDGNDTDGDGVIDEGYLDTDGDGIADCVDLDDDADGLSDQEEIDCGTDPTYSASFCEICDGLDNDGDGEIDEGFSFVDSDGDGISDCAEIACGSNSSLSTSTCETCGDAIDNDGDGLIDEGFTLTGTCNDGDPNTVNDVYQNGCTCVGTSLGVEKCNDGLEDFALFTSTGAVSNAGISTINGHVGTNVGALTGFGSPSTLTGTAFAPGLITAQAVIDVQYLYNQLLAAPPTIAHIPAFGSGETVLPGIYAIAGAGSLAGTLTLDGQGNHDAVFVFKFGGAFTTGATSNVILVGGAEACNVYWISAGAISMGASTHMKGTLISSPGAVSMAAGGILEGRLLSTTGAIAISGATITNPCAPTACDDNDPSTENDVLDAHGNCAGTACPPAGLCCDDGDASTSNDTADGNCNCAGTYSPPSLGTTGTETFALFTSAGAVSSAGVSTVSGKVGTNAGAITGFSPAITEAANALTAGAVTDVQNLYNQLLATPQTVFGHAPAFGSETLTPGVYAIAGAGSVGLGLELDGQGNSDAVFIFKFGGAFTTGAGATVTLTGGAQHCNVYWISAGAIAMAANTTIVGTIISSPGAVSMAAGGVLEGRLFSTAGAIAVSGASITLPTCSLPSGSGTPCTSPTAFAIPNMVSFNAKKDGIHTQVDWMMIKDVEVDFYEVEVSTDGNTFTLLNEMDATRSNSPRQYEAIDLKPAFGENFYRLKVNQLDGSFFY